MHRICNRHYSPNAFAVMIAALVGLCNGCKPDDDGSLASAVAYNAVLDSANHLYDAGHQSRAVQYLDSASINYPHLNFRQKVDNYTLHYNYYFHIVHNNDKAMYYADTLLKLSKTTGNAQDKLDLYSKASFYKGDALFSQNRYNEAYFYYYQGKQASSQSNRLQDCMLSDYSYHMGMILYKQEHYNMAAKYFKNSFRETCTCTLTFRSFYRRQELLNNIGISYSKANEPDSAVTYFDKALNYINTPVKGFTIADSLLQAARGVVYGNQASVYIKQNKYAQAKALLKKSIAINSKKGFDNDDALLSELKLAKLHKIQGHNDSMLAVLKTVRREFDTIKNDAAKADWCYLMAGYYENTRQLPRAIAYFKSYDSVKTIVSNKTQQLKANDVAEQLKRFEKDYEVNRLKKTNEQKNVYLIIAAAFFLMAVIILLLIFLNWRKSKKLLATLSELNMQVYTKNTDLEKALQKLELSSQEKDRILRTVAHDLRNPIGGIASLTGSVIEDDGYTPEQRACLRLVKDTAYNTLELINEILEATNSRPDNIDMQWVEINGVVNSSVELLRFKAAEKNQEIVLTLLKQPRQILMNQEKIWRVVSNILSNAIKFSPIGSTIDVTVKNQADGVQIAVKDHGIGIPDDIKGSVFNIFTEAKRPGTLGEKSFGLGLSICRHIIDLHTGQLWYTSAPERGTTFYIKLPAPPAL